MGGSCAPHVYLPGSAEVAYAYYRLVTYIGTLPPLMASGSAYNRPTLMNTAQSLDDRYLWVVQKRNTGQCADEEHVWRGHCQISPDPTSCIRYLFTYLGS